MKKQILKIVIVFISMVFIINITNTYASTLGDILSGGKDFISSADANIAVDQTKLKETSDGIYNTLLMASFVVVALVGISLGIKFMIAGVNEKAEVKKALIVFFIGCVVVYGAFGIWKVLVSFLSKI